jgi:hypothetical protein
MRANSSPSLQGVCVDLKAEPEDGYSMKSELDDSKHLNHNHGKIDWIFLQQFYTMRTFQKFSNHKINRKTTSK